MSKKLFDQFSRYFRQFVSPKCFPPPSPLCHNDEGGEVAGMTRVTGMTGVTGVTGEKEKEKGEKEKKFLREGAWTNQR